MKKLAILLIAICLVLSAASCGTHAPPTSPGHSVTPTSSFAATTPPHTPTLVPTQGELEIHFINVGQGDSILIDLGETEVLIDGGEKSPGVVDYLKKYVDGPLEVMVATHPHSDHIGGLIAVLAAFQVQQIWHNGEDSDSSTYSQFMSAVQTEGAQVYIGKRGDRIITGSLTFVVLNPRTPAGTVNNNSIVLSLSYGQIDFLFMADAEKEAEGAMLVAADMPVPDVEILKVGHHGSRTASSKDFLAAASPEVAVYMAGTGNRYGHPHQETLAALAQIGAKIFGTDVNGTITVKTDGWTFVVQTER
jgi:competence protein ComEC